MYEKYIFVIVTWAVWNMSSNYPQVAYSNGMMVTGKEMCLYRRRYLSGTRFHRENE